MLATAHRIRGRKVDVVGMDACLMTMIEVAYQLREHAHVLVGSEELEPGPGWPHAAILGDLTARPAMTAGELGGTVVSRYVESYRHGGEIATQSAIDLGQLDDLVDAVDVLAHRLLDEIKGVRLAGALRTARGRTLQFYDGLYVDLHHLAGNIANAVGSGPIADACLGIQRVIDAQGAPSPIIAAAHVGARMAPACGLSIYFPAHRDPTVHYRDLEFAKADAVGRLPGSVSRGRSRVKHRELSSRARPNAVPPLSKHRHYGDADCPAAAALLSESRGRGGCGPLGERDVSAVPTRFAKDFESPWGDRELCVVVRKEHGLFTELSRLVMRVNGDPEHDVVPVHRIQRPSRVDLLQHLVRRGGDSHVAALLDRIAAIDGDPDIAGGVAVPSPSCGTSIS